jgi:uncharacterized membrane protein
VVVIRSSAPERRGRSPRSLAVVVTVAAVTGLIAATALTIDKLALLSNPGAVLTCNLSLLVSCSKGLVSWQGSLLGFPNSIVGMAAWAILLAVGIIMFTASELSRLVWMGLNVGLAGAFALVVFLIAQSIFVLGGLCPWCMVTWAVTIPVFFAVSAFNLRNWAGPRWMRMLGRVAYQWLPLLTFGSLVLIAVLAQLRLNLLQSF